jgi:hypothetical protein
MGFCFDMSATLGWNNCLYRFVLEGLKMRIRLYKGWKGRFLAKKVTNRRIFMNSLANLQANEIARDEKWHDRVLHALPSETLSPTVLAKLQRAVQERISLLPANAIMLPRKPYSRLLPRRQA